MSAQTQKGLFCVVVVCVAMVFMMWEGEGSWAKDKERPKANFNPGQPFTEIFSQIGILNDKLDDLLAKEVDLRGLSQNWDKQLDSTNGDANGCNSDRFTCIFPDVNHPDGAAVRDNETGLVWDRFPEEVFLNWRDALGWCGRVEPGRRKGFHLPTLEQLQSLYPLLREDLIEPNGPFRLLPGTYWSATTNADDPAFAEVWQFVPFVSGRTHKVNSLPTRIFCVRGGQTYDRLP
ncbi:MAG: DUF1566 domain-containing protein [Nitrospira sp.]|nr:DUF1566 domain-containing protein [Nitrospira sp.]MCA9501132.1 DUF1566 domain-containing protein [Nitrospira sp.]